MTARFESISRSGRRCVVPCFALSVAALALAACGGEQAGAAGTSSSGGGSPAQRHASAQGGIAGPVDACALLTAAEVAPLVPGAQPTASTSGANGGPTNVCDWAAAGGGLPTLQVSVTPDSPALKQGLGASRDYLRRVFEHDAEENSGRVVSDLGDLAKVESVVALSAEATVILGTTWVQVELSAMGAKDKQDQVLALARMVVKRLESGR